MTDCERARRLFDGWEETMVWSCLQGHMGRLESGRGGRAARITSGDFCFLAGEPDRGLVESISVPLVTARTEDWHPVIEAVWGTRAVPDTRYAIRKEPGIFDRQRLAALAAALPPDCTLRPMDEAMVPVLLAQGWSRDFCSCFDGPGDFVRRGLGVAALWEGVPVAGASSYIIYEGGIEIEIDTRPDHRRRGLAAVCGAALILMCLERGLYPSWDACDLRSVALAEKLGYRRGEPYPIYWLQEAPGGGGSEAGKEM